MKPFQAESRANKWAGSQDSGLRLRAQEHACEQEKII
jgi:hypothetical protein